MVLIGVVPNLEEKRKLSVNQDYIDAVIRAGGTPVIFPMTEDEAAMAALLDRVDGLLLTGGVDVEPERYGEEKRACCGECTPERDRMELPLCRMAVARDMPLLAICRGLQVLSCALGGTLYQDLAEEFSPVLRHPCYETPAEAVHEVHVTENSLLASITGSGSLGVNSRHHQGIRAPGQGLVISAKAPDGLAEAVEMPDRRFVLAVQWHPESMSARVPVQQRLFDAFVRACEA